MKKIIDLILVLSIQSAFSQNLSYGPIIGTSVIDIKLSDEQSLEGGAGRYGINIGVFGDYKLNTNFGLKTELIFNIAAEESFYDIMRSRYSNRLFERTKTNTLQINSYLKYNVDGDYNKGVHGLVGLNLTSIISMNPKRDDDIIDNFYKNSSIGLLIGLGTSSSYNLNFEIVGQYGLTNLLKLYNEKTKVLGIFINFSYAFK